MFFTIHNTLTGETWKAPILKNEVWIGRSKIGDLENDQPDIVLNSRLVSKEHAIFRIKGKIYTIEHTGTNETLLNDKPIKPHQEQPLGLNDDIKIAEFSLSITEKPLESSNSEPSFGLDQLIKIENIVHHRLLELMDLRRGELAIDLEDQETQIKIQNHLDDLVEETFTNLSEQEIAEVARIAIFRRLSWKITAAGSPSKNGSIRYIGLLNRPFEEMLDNNLRDIGGFLGISFSSKNMEEDSKILDGGFKDAYKHFELEFTPGLLKYAGMIFLKRNILDLIFGLGPLQELMEMDSISEIMVVSRNQIYIEKFGIVEDSRRAFFSDTILLSVIQRIVSKVGRRIDQSTPLVDAHLPDGSRVNAVIPPLALKGPFLTIRKFSEVPLVINDLVDFKALSRQMTKFIKACVEGHKNIIVSGGTGSGKTTFLNCLSGFIPYKERIVTIEDTAELQLKQNHVVTLESRPANMEGKGAITIRDLVKNALRMRPDRIIVGECRGAETLDMLQAMNTGHDGSMTTGHANSPVDMMRRIETMVLLGTPMPVSAIRDQIASAVHIIIQMNRFPDGSRRVTHISEVTGIDEERGNIIIEDIFIYKISATNNILAGKHIHTGYIPTFIEEMLTKNIIQLDTFF